MIETRNLVIGQKPPNFILPAIDSSNLDNPYDLNSASLIGSAFVLYFYPKDLTSGCTMQAENFRDQYDHFKALGVHIIGVSKDPIKRHIKFINTSRRPI